MPELSYEIDAQAQRFVSGLEPAIRKAMRFDNTLEDLTDGQVRYNREAKRFIDQTGAFVSRARVKALAAEKLAASTRSLASGSSSAQQAIFSLGYVMNDAQQFSYGFSQGIRAISNNVPILIGQLATMEGGLAGMAGALTGTTGLILLLSAASTAVSLWATHAEQAKGPTGDLKDQLKGVADQMVQIKTNQPVFTAQSLDAARQMRDYFKEQAESIKKILNPPVVATNTGFSPFFGGSTIATTVSPPKGPSKQEREAAKRDLAEYNSLLDAWSRKIREAEAQESMAAKQRKANVTGIEETTEETDKNKTAYQKLTEQLKEHRKELAELQGPRGLAIAALQQENELLQHQIEVTKRLNAERVRNGGTVAAPGLRTMIQQGLVEAQAKPKYNPDGSVKQTGGLRTLPESLGRQLEAIVARQTKESFEELDQVVVGLMDNIDGLHGKMAVLWADAAKGAYAAGEAFGSFGQLAAAMYESSGERHKEYFKIFKGISIAEAIANTAVGVTRALASAPPPLNFIAAAAVAAAGVAEVLKISSLHPGGGGGGAAGMSRGGGAGGSAGMYGGQGNNAYSHATVGAHHSSPGPVSVQSPTFGAQAPVVHVEVAGVLRGQDIHTAVQRVTTSNARAGRVSLTAR